MTNSIVINGSEVPVKSSAMFTAQDEADCLASPLFKDWAENNDEGIKFSEIKLTDFDRFGKRIGFLKMTTKAKVNGVDVPGICFLRSAAVSILLRLICEGETWVVCTRQARIPVGRSALLELPAGMTDDSGAFAGVAAKELEEETGIRLPAEALIDLTAMAQSKDPHGTPSPLTSYDELHASAIRGKAPGDRGMYPSAGGCNEFLRLMFHERTVTREPVHLHKP
ncbi:MAG: NUDIX domain-containing protein [Alphaproteobacteria bacterium]|nr:NUDIX domain-containing protein [Alphaproteobacteria bacterium]